MFGCLATGLLDRRHIGDLSQQFPTGSLRDMVIPEELPDIPLQPGLKVLVGLSAFELLKCEIEREILYPGTLLHLSRSDPNIIQVR
jgi:hypothetical protein